MIDNFKKKQVEMDLRMSLATISDYHENSQATQILISTAMNSVTKLVGIINTPKHETVEQWETRTGESYPEDAPVWYWDEEYYSDCGEYLLTTWEDYSPDKSLYVANHHGKPGKE